LLTLGTDAMIQYRAFKRLSDWRKNGVATHADQIWASNVWAPRTLAAGWKCWALLQPAAPSDRLEMRRVATALFTGGLSVRVFHELDGAYAWLDEQ
jgi:hypothetical protein